MPGKIEKIIAVFKSKTVWTRVLVTLGIIGMMSYLILSDQSCQFGDFKCDTKSKVNVDVKRGQ
jgi:hypothetical protein